tara:strand:+ start:174 stop:443 length:270 start_codon:yes stop_codon:yes gene_type:complete
LQFDDVKLITGGDDQVLRAWDMRRMTTNNTMLNSTSQKGTSSNSSSDTRSKSSSGNNSSSSNSGVGNGIVWEYDWMGTFPKCFSKFLRI